MSGRHQPPKPSGKDYAHSLATAGLGSIPMLGAAAAELFQMIVTPSLERRRVQWMEEVAEALRTLEEREQLTVEELASNETFVDTMMQASSTAMRNHHEEKRTALRNAVLNSALPDPPDHSRQQMFIQLVDTMTVWHLRILNLLGNPLKWFQEAGRQPPQYAISSSLSGLLIDAYPELKDQRDLYDQIGKDLHNRGLIGSDSFHVMMSANGAYRQRATKLGQQFLDFITAPIPAE